MTQKGKKVITCAFLPSKTKISCNLWKVLRDRSVSPFRNCADPWQLTPDMWQVTLNTWHMTHGGGWTISQNFSSLALTVWDLWCLEDWEENDHRLNESISNKAVCRTAPATLGLLIKYTVWKMLTQHLEALSLFYLLPFLLPFLLHLPTSSHSHLHRN